MVEITVTASVKVAGGPTLSVGLGLAPQAYTFATVGVEAGETVTVDLLPEDGTVALLALSARTTAVTPAAGGTPARPAGSPAAVTVTPVNGATTGDAFGVEGTLLAANQGVLAALVTGGPRSITLENGGTVDAVVDVLTGLQPAP